MRITFNIPEFTRNERNSHCDVLHITRIESPTSSWMTRSQRSRRRDKGLYGPIVIITFCRSASGVVVCCVVTGRHRERVVRQAARAPQHGASERVPTARHPRRRPLPEQTRAVLRRERGWGGVRVGPADEVKEARRQGQVPYGGRLPAVRQRPQLGAVEGGDHERGRSTHSVLPLPNYSTSIHLKTKK